MHDGARLGHEVKARVRGRPAQVIVRERRHGAGLKVDVNVLPPVYIHREVDVVLLRLSVFDLQRRAVPIVLVFRGDELRVLILRGDELRVLVVFDHVREGGGHEVGHRHHGVGDQIQPVGVRLRRGRCEQGPHLRPAALGALQQLGDVAPQVQQAEGPGEVAQHAQASSVWFGDVARPVDSAHEDRGHVGSAREGAKLVDHREPVVVRQHDVHEHEVGRLLLEGSQCRGPGGGGGHVEPLELED